MKPIHFLWCAWSAWTTLAAASLPVRLNPDAWTLQTQNPEDGSATLDGETLVLRRGSKGREVYLTRAYQDLPVTGGQQLLLRVAARIEGPGRFQALLYTAGPDGAWDEAGIQRGEPLRQGPEEAKYRSVFTVPEDAVKIRLSLNLAGEDSLAVLRSISLDSLGEQRRPIVSPSSTDATFDGRAAGPFWESAPVLSPFRVLGDVARRSPLKQEARAAVRDGYLYLSGRFEEPDPAGIRAGREDVLAIHDDDCAEIFLSTDRVAYSHVLVNAAGAKYWDWKIDGRPSPTWFPSAQTEFRGEWDAKAAMGENAWTWEFRVRINDLFEGPVGGEQTLYLNVTRHRPRDAEPYSTWVPLAGATFHVPREFQPITLRLPEAAENDLFSVPPGVFTKQLSVPDLLLSGRPLLLTQGEEKFLLPAECEIRDGAGLAESVLTDLRNDLSVGRGPRTVVTLALGDLVADAEWTDEQRRRFEGPEAFRLNLTPGRAEITGRTRDGVLRGVATLRLLARRARVAPGMSLPGMILMDAPGLPYRGFMLHFSDPIESVKHNLDALFLLRMNKVVFDLSSHSARTWFPFESLAVGRSDRTKEDWAGIFQYARDRGIEPIPYMHSWSRVQYFRHAPEPTAHLYVEDKGSERYPHHRSLDVARPETHPFMLNLQKEIVDLLQPEEFHIAMDETHFSRTIVSEAAIARGWKPSDWYVEAISVNDRFLKEKGVKRMSIWGDMIDIGQNGRHMDVHGLELLARLPKDLTIYDWKYEGRFDHATEFPSIAFFKNAGYRTIGCPWFRPNNVARIAHSVYRAGAEGLLLTAWGDTNLDRLPAEMVRAAGLAGYLSWTPEDADLARFPFVADTLLGAAAYWTDLPAAAAEARSLPPPSAGLTAGPELLRLLGLPDRMDPGFLLTPFTDARGVTVRPFLREGRPAAIAVRGTGNGFRNSDFSRGLSGWTVQIPEREGRVEVENGEMG
ncbi:MAG: family 20 glycosylhydrolase, partial [Kiritimatiellia bacterium]|nr:family 20 glycosylhydrolase [Kiritimatiellia bacterium]